MNEEIDFEEFAPWLLGVITLLGGILRIFLLGNKGMWLDETFSVWLANHSIGEMLHWMVQIDQHPPLYYLLLHYWIGLQGDAPNSVRLLSALLGAATIPIIYLIGKRMSGVVAGLAAAVLLALSPFNIYFAQDTRMYTLLTFNATVAIYALVRLLTDSRSTQPIGSQFRAYLQAWRTLGPVEPKPNEEFSYQDQTRSSTGWRAGLLRHRWLPIQAVETDLAWVAFIAFSAATLLTHNTAVFFVLATNLFVLGLLLFQRSKKPASGPGFFAPSWANWVKAQLGILLLWSPWIYPFIVQASRVYQEFWVTKPTWEDVLYTLGSFFFFNESVRDQTTLLTIIWTLYAAMLGLGLIHYRKGFSRFLFLAVLFAVPLLGELVVSLLRPIFLGRTLIWITIPLLLALAAGIAQLRFRFAIILTLGILATINLFSASDYYKWGQPPEDWNSATREVVTFAEQDDLVLFNASWVQIPFDYYFKTFSENSIQVEKFKQVEKHGVPVDLFDSGILEPKMTYNDVPRLISLLQGHKRVWLVYSHNFYTDPNGVIPQTLAAHMQLIRQSDFYGVQIFLYGAR